MKKRRVIAILLAVVMSAALLTGCGSSVPAKELVKGNLDAVFLGKYSTEYLKMVDIDETQAEKDYETGIDSEVEFFAQYFDIDLSLCGDSYREEIADMYRQIYAKSKYEVGNETSNGDTYLVELTVYPIDLFDKIMNEDAENFDTQWQSRIDNGEFDNATEEEYDQAWARAVIDLVKSKLPTIGYLEAQTISVQVTKDDDDKYSIDSGDFDRIDALIIQY